jgi:hypothetical protein
MTKNGAKMGSKVASPQFGFPAEKKCSDVATSVQTSNVRRKTLKKKNWKVETK